MPQLLTFYGLDGDQFAINPEDVQWVAQDGVGEATVICMTDGTQFVTDSPFMNVIDEIDNA